MALQRQGNPVCLPHSMPQHRICVASTYAIGSPGHAAAGDHNVQQSAVRALAATPPACAAAKPAASASKDGAPWTAYNGPEAAQQAAQALSEAHSAAVVPATTTQIAEPAVTPCLPITAHGSLQPHAQLSVPASSVPAVSACADERGRASAQQAKSTAPRQQEQALSPVVGLTCASAGAAAGRPLELEQTTCIEKDTSCSAHGQHDSVQQPRLVPHAAQQIPQHVAGSAAHARTPTSQWQPQQHMPQQWWPMQAHLQSSAPANAHVGAGMHVWHGVPHGQAYSPASAQGQQAANPWSASHTCSPNMHGWSNLWQGWQQQWQQQRQQPAHNQRMHCAQPQQRQQQQQQQQQSPLQAQPQQTQQQQALQHQHQQWLLQQQQWQQLQQQQHWQAHQQHAWQQHAAQHTTPQSSTPQAGMVNSTIPQPHVYPAAEQPGHALAHPAAMPHMPAAGATGAGAGSRTSLAGSRDSAAASAHQTPASHGQNHGRHAQSAGTPGSAPAAALSDDMQHAPARVSAAGPAAKQTMPMLSDSSAPAAAPAAAPQASCQPASTWKVPDSWLFAEDDDDKKSAKYTFGKQMQKRLPAAQDVRSFSGPRKRSKVIAEGGAAAAAPATSTARQDSAFFKLSGYDLHLEEGAGKHTAAQASNPGVAAAEPPAPTADPQCTAGAAQPQSSAAPAPSASSAPSGPQPVQNLTPLVQAGTDGKAEPPGQPGIENAGPTAPDAAATAAASPAAANPKQSPSNAHRSAGALRTMINAPAPASRGRRAFVTPARVRRASPAAEPAAGPPAQPVSSASAAAGARPANVAASAGNTPADPRRHAQNDAVASGWSTGAGRSVAVSRQALEQQRARRQLQDAAGRGEE